MLVQYNFIHDGVTHLIQTFQTSFENNILIILMQKLFDNDKN